MTTRHAVVLASLLLAFISSVARADWLGFDDLDPALGSAASQEYAGFQWDNRWVLGNTRTAGYENVTTGGFQYLFNANLQSKLVVRRDEVFDFLGAYIAAPDLRSGSSWINISAFDAGNNLIGSTGYQKLGKSPLWFGTDFSQVSRVVIDPYGGYFALSGFEFRDMEVEVSEAGSLVLLLVGLGGLWFARRRMSRSERD